MNEMELILQRIIRDKESLSRKIAYWEFKSKKCVFVSGYFDVLTKENAEYLAAAADKADRMIVGIYSDEYAKKDGIKLVNNEDNRANLLACLRFVNVVTILNEPAKEMVDFLKPNEVMEGDKY